MKYIELAFGVQNRNNIYPFNKDIWNYVQPEKELYRSNYLFDEQILKYVSKNKSVAGYNGNLISDEIVVDIDDDPNINLKKVLSFIKDNLIPENAFQVWYSGSRGYHIHFSSKLWGFAKSPIVYKDVSETMKSIFPFADPTAYSKNHLIRFRNSYHKKSGNYKVFIDHQDLDTIKLEEIDASSPKAYKHKMNYRATKPILDIKYAPVIEYKNEYSKIYPVNTEIKRYNCIHNIHNSFWERAKNNHTNHKELLVLINHYKTIHNYSKDIIKNILAKYFEYYVSIKSYDELEKMIEYSYKYEYNFGCNHSYLQEYCSSNCIYFKGRFGNSMETTEEEYLRIMSNMKDRINLSPIFPYNDEYFIMPTEMIFLLGAPGVGKTTFLFYIINKLKLPTLFISSDSASFMLYQKAIQNLTGLTDKELLESLISGKRYSNLLTHLEFKDSSVEASHIEELVKQSSIKPKIVVIDPTTAFEGSGRNEKEVLDKAMGEIRTLSNRTGLIFIISTHLNRNDSRTNTINMFSGYMSSRIEKNADKMIGIKRSLSSMESEGSNVLTVGHIKNRFGENLKLHNYRIDFKHQQIELMRD